MAHSHIEKASPGGDLIDKTKNESDDGARLGPSSHGPTSLTFCFQELTIWARSVSCKITGGRSGYEPQLPTPQNR